MGRMRTLSCLMNVELRRKLPLVELTGHSRVLVENHIGVIAYSQEKIVIRVSFGSLVISGENLKLAEMQREQLVIFGQIEGVYLQKEVSLCE